MLRTVVMYRGEGQEVPIIEAQGVEAARFVARLALRQFAEGMGLCDDPVLSEIIRSEADQVRRVLQAAGIEIAEALPS